MSKEVFEMRSTGPNKLVLNGDQFYGGKGAGKCIQLTQGLGGQKTPGYIQLTKTEAAILATNLEIWLENA